MEDRLAQSDRQRSNFIREVVQRSSDRSAAPSHFSAMIPCKIVQFWDNSKSLPDDVAACIATWGGAEAQGFTRQLFNSNQAKEYIQRILGERYKAAFDRCYHPAMQSDYFRLCTIFAEGGFYIDADDVFHGNPIRYLSDDSRLKIQPLCYDMETGLMVSPSTFLRPGADSINWIFYFNSNPLIAGARHPLVGRALNQATITLEQYTTSGLPEIQSTAGPGNLTKAIFDAACEGERVEGHILVLREWEDTATSKWPLSYRNDARNWRLSNCQAYEAHVEDRAWGEP